MLVEDLTNELKELKMKLESLEYSLAAKDSEITEAVRRIANLESNQSLKPVHETFEQRSTIPSTGSMTLGTSTTTTPCRLSLTSVSLYHVSLNQASQPSIPQLDGSGLTLLAASNSQTFLQPRPDLSLLTDQPPSNFDQFYPFVIKTVLGNTIRTNTMCLECREHIRVCEVVCGEACEEMHWPDCLHAE